MKNKKKLTSKEYADRLQQMYVDGKVLSKDFKDNIMNLIKKYLALYLLKKGFYKNGILQHNYDNEDLEDCYTYILCHILGTYKHRKSNKKSLVKYDPEKGNITSFIRMWIFGYSNSLLARQRKEYKYQVHRIYSLDEILQTSTPNNCIYNDLFNQIDDNTDEELFRNKFKIKDVEINYDNKFNSEYFSRLNSIKTLEFIRRDFFRD
jgi:hypothetical protein